MLIAAKLPAEDGLTPRFRRHSREQAHLAKVNYVTLFGVLNNIGVTTFTTCNIENRAAFTARLLAMGYRHREFWQHGALLCPGERTIIDCPTGQLMVLVFDDEQKTFYQGRYLSIAGAFRFVIG